MKVRRNISVDETTNKNLIKLADLSHRTVSQWITDRVCEHIGRRNKSVSK